jgi:hypothetical protein
VNSDGVLRHTVVATAELNLMMPRVCVQRLRTWLPHWGALTTTHDREILGIMKSSKRAIGWKGVSL